jgi:hypothetical protein
MAITAAITRADLSAAGLRNAAAQTQDAKAAGRMLAFALVLEDRSREAGARGFSTGRAGGMGRSWRHCSLTRRPTRRERPH